MKTMWKRPMLASFAGALLIGGLAAGCGANNNSSSASPSATVQTRVPAPSPSPSATMTTMPGMAMGPDTQAATLRANLTALLESHVYLAGTATGAALRGDTAGFTAAAKTLDANSVALSKAIGSVYGTPAETAFLDLWRKHIGFFVDYTQAKAAGDTAKADKAKADLDGYRADFGAFIASANPNLPKDAVAMELKPHVDSLLAAIDAQAAGDPTAYDKLAASAGLMPMTAQVLSGGIAKQFPDKVSGDPTSAGATLRANLTALLESHVYLAGTATGAALRGDTAGFTAAAKTLDANSVALSKAIGSVYGGSAETAFLDLWRKHIVFFVDYTQAKAAGDTAKAAKAKADLDGYRADFGAFIASANPNLPKDAVAMELKPHVDSLFAAIDAQAAGDPTAYDKLAAAAGMMPNTAQVLSGGIAKQFPDKFGK